MFLLPGFPKDALCYFLGLTRLRFLDFILMNLLGDFRDYDSDHAGKCSKN